MSKIPFLHNMEEINLKNKQTHAAPQLPQGQHAVIQPK